MIEKDKHLSKIIGIFKFILESYPFLVKDTVNIHRQNLSNKIWDMFNGNIQYGPFKGQKIQKNPNWGSCDKASMILGLYEKEILDNLSDVKGKYRTFVDLGAGDGYYGIGVLVGNICEKSHLFEISENGRKIIENSITENCMNDKASLHGEADHLFYQKIPDEDLSSSLLFVDIEGAEFDILQENVFEVFKNSLIFIELHDWFYPDASEKIIQLKQKSSKTHHWREIKMGARDLSGYPELKNFDDTDRWILCSEGRAQLMTWVRLDPRF